jgi:hypothetical protein
MPDLSPEMSLKRNITKDKDGREWIHASPPLYYLHRYKPPDGPREIEGKWVVIDRKVDLCVTGLCDSRGQAISEFMRKYVPKEEQQEWELRQEFHDYIANLVEKEPDNLADVRQWQRRRLDQLAREAEQ